MDTLRKFLGRYFGSIPEPKSCQLTRWYSNPFFRGSYSYHTTEGEAAAVTPQDLAEPVLMS
jgi:hypothetical protein